MEAMSDPERYLIDRPNQPPPDGTKCVGDLLPLVGDSQRVLFCGQKKLAGTEPPLLRVSSMGGYVNHGLPKLVPWPDILERPTPKRRSFAYRSLSSLGEPTVEFNGNPKWTSDLYQLGSSVFLVSDKLLSLLTESSSDALEVIRPRIVGERAGKIGTYWIVMPTHVLDAVDVSKSCILIRRPEIVPGSRKFVTHVNYIKGFVFREDIPSHVSNFVDEFTSDWFWHLDLIRRVRGAGVRGLHFGFWQVDLASEIKLRGPDDPSGW